MFGHTVLLSIVSFRMKLAAYFPDYAALNRTKLYDKGDCKRLTLRINHVVSGTVGGVGRVGEGNIDYNIDFPKKADFTGRLRLGGYGYVGVQSSDLINQATQELRPRTAYSFSKVVNTKFDLRALCYVLGAATAIGVGDCDFDVPLAPAGYRTLGTGWSVPDIGDLVFGPTIANTPREFATLMSLCGEAGVKSCTILSDDIPGTSGNFMVGRDLACYARRVVNAILLAASETLSYGAHRKAYEHGKTSAMRLNAHSDEGGWLRKLMLTASYPVPCGIVYGMGVEFNGVPLQENVQKEDIMKLIISEYLEYVALFPLADLACHGQHSLISADVAVPKRLSDFDILTPQLFSVMEKMKDLVCDLDGFHHDANKDINAHTYYVEENSVDGHFTQPVLFPWWFVEPTPLLIGLDTGALGVAQQGKVVKLRMFEADDVAHNSNSLDSLGRAGPGCKSWIYRSPTTLRKEGASYLLSSSYTVKNGLGQLSVKEAAPGGETGADLLFIDKNAPTLAAGRWVTPHNSMPTPVEGLTMERSIFEYTHVSSTNDLTPEEMFSGMVESRFGNFYVVDDSPDAVCSTHRDVPNYIKRRLKFSKESFAELTHLKVVSVKHNTIPAFAVSTPLVETAEVETQEDKKPHTKPVKKSDTPDLEADKPKVSLKPSDTGVKPVQPVVKTAGPDKDEKSDNGRPAPSS